MRSQESDMTSIKQQEQQRFSDIVKQNRVGK